VAKTNPRKIDLKARSWELLRSGWSVRDIAKKLGTIDKPISTQQIIAWRDEILKEIAETTKLNAEQYRAIELERLDKSALYLENAIAQLVGEFGLDSDAQINFAKEETDSLAIAAIKLKSAQILGNLIGQSIKISDARAKLLGLNSPSAIEVSMDSGVSPKELANLTTEQLLLFFAEQHK